MPYRFLLALCLVASLATAETTSLAPFKGRQISRVVIRGVAKDVAAQLRVGLASSGKSGLLGDARAILFSDLIEADIARLRLQLARTGYPYATVIPTFTGVEKDRRVEVAFDIDLSTPVVVDTVIVSGLPDTFEPPESRWRRIFVERPFRDADLNESVTTLRDVLRLNGYARATVSSEVTTLDRERVHVTIDVSAGDTYVFDGVRVTGVHDDLVSLVTRVSDVEPGDAYSTDTLKRARFQLQLLGLFSRIQLSTLDTAPGRLDLVVDVTERPFRSAEAGVGYWTDDFFRVQARWQHQNLFHRGRGFRANGFASGRRRRVDTTAWWPGIAGARVLGRIGGSFEQQLEDAYDLIDVGAETSLTYRHSIYTTLGTGLGLSWITIDEKTDDAVYEEEGGRILTAHLTWNRQSTDNPIDPTRGADVTWRAETSVPGRFSETHYVRLETGAKAYVSPRSGVVLAARVEGGVAWPTEGSVDLLPNIRFFAGGGGSMRGFARRRLGPVDSDDEPIGGEALVEASAEVRVPVWWKLRAAAFLDAAEVWSNRHDVAIDELEVAAGPALMITTPVGPIRADLGVRLGPITDAEPRTAFHLSIGHPY